MSSWAASWDLLGPVLIVKQLLTVAVPILVAEGYLRVILYYKLRAEFDDAGSFITDDSRKSAERISKLQGRLNSGYNAAFALIVFAVGALASGRKVGQVDGVTYGSIGVLVGLILFIYIAVLAYWITSRNFERKKGVKYWKSFLTAPVRIVFYAYYAVWTVLSCGPS